MDSDPVVSVKQGLLRGSVERLYDGTQFFSFKGVPYAQPPVAELRFKAPLPPKPWDGVLDATKHGPICPQIKRSYNINVKSNEDCLYLNVYTRSLQQSSKAAVMVFIHGGGYMTGSGNSREYGPEFLLQNDVVLVTFNYRLELFGFLCLNIAEVPGNAGMKDQVAALRWVKENINNFGGNPDNITIFGESAGGTSVTYHMMSPISNGLFHKAIAQSGVCICDWAQGKDSVERAFRVGKLLGKETQDVQELFNFFKSLPTEVFLDHLTFKTFSKDEKYRGLPITFSPVVEKKFEGEEHFLCEDVLSTLQAGSLNKVPLIVGYNTAEAITLTAHQQKIVNFTNKNLGYSVPREIAVKISTEQLNHFGKRIRLFYVGEREFTKDDVQALCDKETDANFLYNTHRFAHFYSKLSKSLFMYRFGCDTDLNLAKKSNNLPNIKGACHVDDLYYLFTNPKVWEVYKNQENCRKLVNTVTKLWTNFAKSGNPNCYESFGVQWSPYTTANKDFLDIDLNLSEGQYADRQRVEFWNTLYSEAELPSITKSSL